MTFTHRPATSMQMRPGDSEHFNDVLEDNPRTLQAMLNNKRGLLRWINAKGAMPNKLQFFAESDYTTTTKLLAHRRFIWSLLGTSAAAASGHAVS